MLSFPRAAARVFDTDKSASISVFHSFLRQDEKAILPYVGYECEDISTYSLTLRIVSCGIGLDGLGLGLASISEARASACVSTYSRMFVSLPFRTVMANTKWSSNVLFVALTFPLAKPTTRTRSPCATNSGGFGNEVSTVSEAF
jgi:hypothetical protein